ncbi:MAG: hypothetical protein AVDCRST_MAG53-663 [uncultured Solirubrobacteraceae bacterium]|uniref:Uncharacterized protein n=1 Tax=uncultured Solirubrobacteraceae bacterium TaxID=1162706 RepID=A0A6J4RYX1_9ACTN|nr:MAG: hypothetical protein AVDCRST_MAG53-663 [uncultured Solirubrobacteraceae bacterium]
MLELVLLTAVVVAAGELPAAPVVGVMTFGLVMAIVGHIARRNLLVGLGIAVLFMATAALVLLAYLDFAGGDSFDPRPRDPNLPPGVYP